MIKSPLRLGYKLPTQSQFQALRGVESSSAPAAQAATTAFAHLGKTELHSSLANANTNAVSILAELNRNSVVAAARVLSSSIINQRLIAVSSYTQLAKISREPAITASRALAEATNSQRLFATARRAQLAEVSLRPAITASHALAEATKIQRLLAATRRAQLAEITRVSRIARTSFSTKFNLRQDIDPVYPFARSTELSKSAILADSIAHMRNADPEFIASDDASVGKLVFRADFSLSVELAPIPQAIGSADSCATFNPKHWLLITQLEQRLRLLVQQKLEVLAGQKWIEDGRPRRYENVGSGANRTIGIAGDRSTPPSNMPISWI